MAPLLLPKYSSSLACMVSQFCGTYLSISFAVLLHENIEAFGRPSPLSGTSRNSNGGCVNVPIVCSMTDVATVILKIHCSFSPQNESVPPLPPTPSPPTCTILTVAYV
jgi:hypothetical protein